MARAFDGTTSIIDCGTAFTRANQATGFTIAAWIYPTSFGENSLGNIVRLNSSAATVFLVDNSSSTATLRGAVAFTTTLCDRRAPTNFITLNTWQFVVMTWNGGSTASSIRLFKGLPGGTIQEASSYSTVANGAGGFIPPDRFTVGNSVASDRTFAGRLAEVYYDT